MAPSPGRQKEKPRTEIMKNFQGLTHYALLELPTDASDVKIKTAYALMKKTYGNDPISTYSLLDNSSRKEVLEKIEEAYSVLGNKARRKEYDLQIGIQPDKAESNLPVSESIRSEKKDSLRGENASRKAPSRAQTFNKKEIADLLEKEIKGSLLREIREKQGIPLQEIADETRINITYLQYIEGDRYKSLPAEVYLKGYLEQYIKYLGLDPAQVVEKFLDKFRESQ